MDQQPTQTVQKRRRYKFVVWISILLIGVCLGYLLYEYSPIGWLYFALRADHFRERVEALVPQYDKLNDTLMQLLPVYPEAVLLPQTQRQRRPGEQPWPPGGPDGPVTSRACFTADDSIEQVVAFYQDALERDGWRLVQVKVDGYGRFSRLLYTKDQACVELNRVCHARFESESKTVYQVEIYHDLNTLLDFPDIPKVIYWNEDVGHCP
jgi:hypothetical protein